MLFKFKKVWLSTLLLMGCMVGSGWVFADDVAHRMASPSSEAQVFDEKTWAAILKSGPQPAAYLFTTSYCSTCPDAFEKIHLAATQSSQKVTLAVVMMDVEGREAVRHATYFPGLTQLYAFDGYEPAIRRSVDQKWPDITPYVVLIDAHAHVQKTIGAPSDVMLKRWLN